MKCDWNLIFDILDQAESYETNDPIVFSVGVVYNGRHYPVKITDQVEFDTVYTNISFIQKFGLADVRDLEYRTAIAINSITPKGSTYLDNTRILKAVEKGQATERSIAKELKLKQHTVNYYLKQFEQKGFITGAESYPTVEAGPLEYHACILKPKGKVALDNHSLLLEEVAMQNNTNNFNAPVGSFGNQGTQTNVTGLNQGTQIGTQYNSSQETIKKVSTGIEKLLDYFEHNDPPITKAQQIVKTATEEQPEILDAEIIEEAINSSPSLRQRIGAAGTAAYIETVKMLLPPFGIAYEAYKAFKSPEQQ